MDSVTSPRLPRNVIAGQTLALSKVARQLVDTARNKIAATNFGALSEIDRAVAYAELETLVREAENISSQALKTSSAL